ncbi:antitoxin [Arthrobacter sp. Soil782]|uniref:antitoxin n=1 Tax=Arthrobacter sp. Soil782 TaxID=1736410 RepID=UPI0009EB4CE7|nr:antitoxin [Arthrobacter sp. Soil782]
MAGFGSLGKIAMGLARNPKVREALNSPQAKQMGSKVVDRVAEAADKATKGKHQDKIQNARGQAQKHLGGPDDGPQAQGPGAGPQAPGSDPGNPRP